MPKRGMLEKFDVFVFDWDGTLANMRFVLRLSDMYKRAFVRKKNLNEYLEIEAAPDSAESRAIVKREERKNEVLSVLYDMMFSFNKPRLQKGSLEAVRYLRSRHKRVALLTNGAYYRVNKEIGHTGMNDMFEDVVSMRTMGSMKPDPRGLLHLVKRMNVDRKRVVYIGDSIDDILAARYAGIEECAIADGFDSEATLKRLKPNYLFRNMEQFYRHLKTRE